MKNPLFPYTDHNPERHSGVPRGGSWAYDEWPTRVDDRWRANPQYPSNNNGFRLFKNRSS